MAEDLVVDLRGRPMETLDDFWDAVAGPCGLPSWFGRNIDAWCDTIQTRGISDVIDSHGAVVVHVDKRGLFARNDRETRNLKRSFAGRQSKLVIHPYEAALNGEHQRP
ncbi:barstar family protein [Actinoplanes sp. LDG1-06]|uniref:Barstar family protein n=1 Tax=Paractinoplanes ovalisporus TaxID=2810368 RepID=A0ABS2AF93_9ACTN|nr:barstar family protein [Actinoplanes ovalisporus]MBM2618497.1 barstar family protein [Actinoplanes ovalisporus]